jgi:hypothetical protein
MFCSVERLLWAAPSGCFARALDSTVREPGRLCCFNSNLLQRLQHTYEGVP